jgi:Astacin (Peptidase family M12A)
VGRIGGSQQLNLQPNGCIWFDTIVHEFMHAFGFFHMQSATDRDNYVAILWQNIISGTEHNFDSYPASMINQFGFPYDKSSVMHYGPFAFSSNGQPTIVSHVSFSNSNQMIAE